MLPPGGEPSMKCNKVTDNTEKAQPHHSRACSSIINVSNASGRVASIVGTGEHHRPLERGSGSSR